MHSLTIHDLTQLFWQVNRAISAGHEPTVDEVRSAMRDRAITAFLNKYDETDLTLYGSDPMCTLDELDAFLDQWAISVPTDLSLSDDVNGLLYLQSCLVYTIQSDEWSKPSGAQNSVRHFERDIDH